jgi:hypothetical protein
VVLAAAGLRVPDLMTKAGAVLELRYAREKMELHVLHLRCQSVLDLRAEQGCVAARMRGPRRGDPTGGKGGREFRS